MASPRLASRPPRACAACYGQYTDRAHVDFQAGYEGALIDPNRPRAGHVDWLVICEKCIRTAAALLPEQASKVEGLQHEIAALKERAEKAEEYADRIELALSHRPERDRDPAPPKVKKAPAQRRNRYEKDEA
jgi:hypothetical protein